MRNILTYLARKYKCDKGRKHNYTEIYHNYFCDMRNKRFKMLEIGFGEGHSIRMWAEYFYNAIIYCIDVLEDLPEDNLLKKYVYEDRFRFFSINQSSTKQLSKILNEK